MQRLGRALRRLVRRRFAARSDVIVTSAQDLLEYAHWIDKPALRMHVPVGLLRMQGGFVYGPTHPFVMALHSGRPALERFYRKVCPATLADYYQLAGGMTGADLSPWEIPWYGRTTRHPPPGERKVDARHGVSFYGPVTAEKIDLELSRLSALQQAIRAHGYAPDAYGDIEGYVMHSQGEACFFVRGGKHRAAVLAARGDASIPVAFRSQFPRVIDYAQASAWPLVRSGQLDIGVARQILTVYTRGRANWDTDDGQAG